MLSLTQKCGRRPRLSLEESKSSQINTGGDTKELTYQLLFCWAEVLLLLPLMLLLLLLLMLVVADLCPVKCFQVSAGEYSIAPGTQALAAAPCARYMNTQGLLD